MANTKTTTFSVRLRPDTKQRLAKLAEASGRSSNFLIGDAVEAYVEDQERVQAEIRAALKEADSGHYIPHEAMKAWLLSWGTDHELPPPRCVCGSVHDEDQHHGDRLDATRRTGLARHSQLHRGGQAGRG
jgi:RHH-type transcriptional regulator, rel operon repressor / antitoxin RelB